MNSQTNINSASVISMGEIVPFKRRLTDKNTVGKCWLVPSLCTRDHKIPAFYPYIPLPVSFV